jgi:hypothetical protein
MTLPPPVNRNNPKPYLSHSPWAGFSAHDHPRDEVLATCPSPRCQRVKQCVAAHNGVYCKRTHISHAEHMARQPKPVPLRDPGNLELRRERLVEQLEQRKTRHDELVTRWKAGEFDGLYGKWTARGVLMRPPVKEFR